MLAHDATRRARRRTAQARRRQRSGSASSTRAVKPVDDLIRFVVGPDGAVVPDLKRKLPGRGLWVTADRATLDGRGRAQGVRARLQARRPRRARIWSDQTERLLERAALDALAIAGKAGQVVAGFGKVEAALARERGRGLLHAADAAADGVRKLDGALRRQRDGRRDRSRSITAFTSAQLDLALGRSNVIHAALLAGPASDTFLARFARLERFRTGETGPKAAPAANGTDRIRNVND